MPRRILPVSALLVVLVACRDGPTQIAAPVQARRVSQPDVTVSVDALRTVTQRLNDPFVHELMGRVGPQLDESLRSAVHDVSAQGMERHVVRLSQVLTAARSALLAGGDNGEEAPDEEMILRAALALMLDDAATLLEKPLPSEDPDRPERDVAQHEPEGLQR